MASDGDKQNSEELEHLRRENRVLRQGVRQAERMQTLWEQALEELKQARSQLKAQNHRLTSLYQAASAVNQTNDMEELLDHVMEVMEQLLELPRPYPMGVFLVEKGDRMRLAAQRLANDDFHRAHEGMKVGDCLCGRAAQGEVIITNNCDGDPRHTLPYVHGEPHGHLILPLKAKNQVVGVFYYYLPPDYEIGPAMLDTFNAISSQLGLAIEHARLYAEVLELTTHDALTCLGNRRYMKEVLERDLYNVERYQGTLSLLLIDIDYFKRYNDTHGHLEGDRLLTKVADVLRDAVRTGDLPVRYGGEEFVVLLPQTDLESAGLAAERIRREIEERTPVTVSLGVSSVSGKRCEPEILIKAADEALYRAKQNGRNRVELSSERL